METRSCNSAQFRGLTISPLWQFWVWGGGKVRYLSDAQLFMWLTGDRLDTSGGGLVGFLAALLAVILLPRTGT